MPMRLMYHDGAFARRDLRREEMTRFAVEQLPWLEDPERVPESASTGLDEVAPSEDDGRVRHLALGKWMADQFVDMSAKIHEELGFDEVFERRGLSKAQQAEVRKNIREEASVSYGTGIMAMAETHGVVPYVSARDGSSSTEWGDIASQARFFGESIARDGTDVTMMIRAYLRNNPIVSSEFDALFFDPSRIRLDGETGITTVTPVEKIISIAKGLAQSMLAKENHSGVCLALQAVPEGFDTDERRMFDVVWNAYNFVARRDIYPYQRPELRKIPSQVPDLDSELYCSLMGPLYDHIEGNLGFSL